MGHSLENRHTRAGHGDRSDYNSRICYFIIHTMRPVIFLDIKHIFIVMLLLNYFKPFFTYNYKKWILFNENKKKQLKYSQLSSIHIADLIQRKIIEILKNRKNVVLTFLCRKKPFTFVLLDIFTSAIKIFRLRSTWIACWY